MHVLGDVPSRSQSLIAIEDIPKDPQILLENLLLVHVYHIIAVTYRQASWSWFYFTWKHFNFRCPFLPSLSCAGYSHVSTTLHFADGNFDYRQYLPFTMQASHFVASIQYLILSFLRPLDDYRNSAPIIRRNLISVPPPEPWHDQFMNSFCGLERMLVLLCIPWSGEQALMAVKLFMSLLKEHLKTTVHYG